MPVLSALNLPDSNKVLLVDVRTPSEFQEDAIPGSINVPLCNVVAEANNLKKASKVMVYCRSGQRSRMAAKFLDSIGVYVKDLGGLDSAKMSLGQAL